MLCLAYLQDLRKKVNPDLITLKRVSNLHDHDLDDSAISLTHMDVIMQEKGFIPMTACEWNSF
jgi:FdhE protein